MGNWTSTARTVEAAVDRDQFPLHAAILDLRAPPVTQDTIDRVRRLASDHDTNQLDTVGRSPLGLLVHDNVHLYPHNRPTPKLLVIGKILMLAGANPLRGDRPLQIALQGGELGRESVQQMIDFLSARETEGVVLRAEDGGNLLHQSLQQEATTLKAWVDLNIRQQRKPFPVTWWIQANDAGDTPWQAAWRQRASEVGNPRYGGWKQREEDEALMFLTALALSHGEDLARMDQDGHTILDDLDSCMCGGMRVMLPTLKVEIELARIVQDARKQAYLMDERTPMARGQRGPGRL